ncbi:hypothetical protein BX286_4662 [Streptomyces sp. 3211.6]|nr:hypothetical protein BX286_4662 [Streptomyces sp. 3211.6]RPF45845.1 hypothetical protein EDD96_2410 [Streptomyces sp. Ag109_G2-6]
MMRQPAPFTTRGRIAWWTALLTALVATWLLPTAHAHAHPAAPPGQHAGSGPHPAHGGS